MASRLWLHPGSWGIVGGRRVYISHVLDLDNVLVRESETGAAQRVKIRDLQPPEPDAERPLVAVSADLTAIEDAAWQSARERFAIIQPLLEESASTRVQVHARAASVGRHPATLYRWLQQYRHSGRLSSLVPDKRGRRWGQRLLHPDVEAILTTTIDEVYLSAQKRSIPQTYTEVERRCRNAGLRPPHALTVRKRIYALSAQETMRRREGGKAVRETYAPLRGSFPGAHWPLAVVQIDHTPVDLILVDDVHRRPVGRPWITLAIDVFSRMVAGFYVSFDPPGAMTVGLCLAHAILPKDTWLARHDIVTSWPIWGVMDTVHADNAKEFRGSMLRKACEEYGIELHWRPVGRPHFGGHIERLLGTLNHEIHTLPGSTFSNPGTRGQYDAEQHAALTLAEFERWLAILIVEVYHQRLHRELGTTPLRKYEEGIFGTEARPGRGLPARVLEETRLRLDFMPYAERTVQRHGIVIDEIQYFDDVLRSWINASDPGDVTGKRKRKFIVRRDPRDLSRVYFYDPDLKQYFEIPYRNTTHPPLSLWALREVRRKLKEAGQQAVNEDLIFDAYTRLRALEAEAVQETKRVRRVTQRRRGHARSARLRPERVVPVTDAPLTSADAIHPFEEIEELHG
jgi:putative transposase